MSEEYLTFAKVFNDTSNLHRVVSFSDLGLFEFQHMRQHVFQLYSILKEKYRSRVIFNFNSPYYSAISFLAACFADKEMILIGNDVPEKYLDNYIESDEIVLTDQNITKFNKAEVIQIKRVLLNSCETFNIRGDKLPEFDADSIEFTLICRSEQNGEIGKFPRTVGSIERELNAVIRSFPQITNNCVFAFTLPITHGFDLVHCSLMAVLARGCVLAKRVVSPQSLAQLSTMDFVFITTCDFINELNPELLIPRATVVFSLGGILSRGAALTASQSFGCSIIQFIGSLYTGCLGYKDPLKSNVFTLFAGVEYQITKDSNLVITKHFIGNNPYTTNYIVAKQDKGFVIFGDKERSIAINGEKYFLDDLERIITNTGKVKNAVAVALKDSDISEYYVGLVVSVTPEMMHILEHSKAKTAFIMDLRKELEGQVPEDLIPRKVRFLNEILYNDNGSVDYSSLLKCFSHTRVIN